LRSISPAAILGARLCLLRLRKNNARSLYLTSCQGKMPFKKPVRFVVKNRWAIHTFAGIFDCPQQKMVAVFLFTILKIRPL